MKTPLPLEWVNKIFTKLTLVYGRDFASRWEGMNISDVKVDWAHELGGFQDNPKAITHALQNLPPAKPPTVLEFRALAQKRPADAVAFLDVPKAYAEKVAAQLLAMAPVRSQPLADSKEWARRIMARHADGDNILLYSLNCAKTALGIAA